MGQGTRGEHSRNGLHGALQCIAFLPSSFLSFFCQGDRRDKCHTLYQPKGQPLRTKWSHTEQPNGPEEALGRTGLNELTTRHSTCLCKPVPPNDANFLERKSSSEGGHPPSSQKLNKSNQATMRRMTAIVP